MQRQPVDIAKLLNLDSARADKVNTILADERKERQALWESRKTVGTTTPANRRSATRYWRSAKTQDQADRRATADELQSCAMPLLTPHASRLHGPQSSAQGGEHQHG